MIGKQSQKKKYPLVNWADGMPVRGTERSV